MRTHTELIELILKHFDKYFFSGLCYVVCQMRRDELISMEEEQYLIQLIHDNPPKDRDPGHGLWYWAVGVKEPRMQWLNKQININS